jgi:hypothetical protein
VFVLRAGLAELLGPELLGDAPRVLLLDLHLEFYIADGDGLGRLDLNDTLDE